MSGNVLKVKEQKDRYKVCYMAGDDSGFDMMEGALLVLESLNLPIDWVRADLGWCNQRYRRYTYGSHHIKGRSKRL